MSILLGYLLLWLTVSTGIGWIFLQVRSRRYFSLTTGCIFVASLAGFLKLRQEHYDWLNRDAFWHFAQFSLLAEETGNAGEVFDALRAFAEKGPFISERNFGFARNELIMSLVHFSYESEQSKVKTEGKESGITAGPKNSSGTKNDSFEEEKEDEILGR